MDSTYKFAIITRNSITFTNDSNTSVNLNCVDVATSVEVNTFAFEYGADLEVKCNRHNVVYLHNRDYDVSKYNEEPLLTWWKKRPYVPEGCHLLASYTPISIVVRRGNITTISTLSDGKICITW